MSSNYHDILTAVQTLIVDAVLDDIEAAVRIRALPRVGETLDTVPCVLIVPTGGEEMEYVFGGRRVQYSAVVAVVAAANRDYATRLESHLAWRSTILETLDVTTLDGAPTVFDITPDPGRFFNPALYDAQYAYLPLSFVFSSAE